MVFHIGLQPSPASAQQVSEGSLRAATSHEGAALSDEGVISQSP